MNQVSHPCRVQPRFELGQIVATPGALEACCTVYLQRCLARHVTGDWGCVSAEDKEANDAAVSAGERILSAYPVKPTKRRKPFGKTTLWIITEADRSATTFLLPDEY